MHTLYYAVPIRCSLFGQTQNMIACAKMPDVGLHDAFLQMVDDYLAHDPANAASYALARENFVAYVRKLSDEERGINVPVGRVPCSHRWLLDESEACVGFVNIRHNIETEFLREEAGHIGYGVAPSFRRRGYGLACLQTGLAVARELGLERVLLYADTDNTVSWKIMEKCGGVLDAERYSSHFGVIVRQYWIAVSL